MRIFNFKEYNQSAMLFGDKGLILFGGPRARFKGPTKENILKRNLLISALYLLFFMLYGLVLFFVAFMLGRMTVDVLLVVPNESLGLGLSLALGSALSCIFLLRTACSLIAPALFLAASMIGKSHEQ